MKTIYRSIITLCFLFVAMTASAATFNLPHSSNSIIGHTKIVKVGFRNIVNLMQQYDIGFFEFVEANPGVRLKHLSMGEQLIIPSRFILPQVARKGIVVNVAELRVYYYFPKKHLVMTFPVGVGKPGWNTPLMKTRILDKEMNPAWIPTRETREDFVKMNGYPMPEIVPSGPENPLGYRAMRFSVPNFLMHGTIDPEGVGQRVSGGCIRMQNKDVEKIFPLVKVDTPVNIIYEPYKAGWEGNTLFLEAHETIPTYPHRSYKAAIRKALRGRRGKIHVNWQKAAQVVRLDLGVPQPIGYVTR